MTTFKTRSEAKNNGWYRINANAILTEYSNNIGSRRLVCRDISGGNSFGYRFKIVVQEKIKCQITDWEDWDDIESDNEIVSKSIYMTNEKNKIGGTGAFSTRFKLSEIEDFARRHLPGPIKLRMFNFK